jgi:hypothetical protein
MNLSIFWFYRFWPHFRLFETTRFAETQGTIRWAFGHAKCRMLPGRFCLSFLWINRENSLALKVRIYSKAIWCYFGQFFLPQSIISGDVAAWGRYNLTWSRHIWQFLAVFASLRQSRVLYASLCCLLSTTVMEFLGNVGRNANNQLSNKHDGGGFDHWQRKLRSLGN